ncbi:MAG TPA: glycosyltransferase family 1 protein [Solirubrobacteraceae bacterium]|nr:glycosyltransferase family 1 protein [Solirubrobacteraceae bacterium]
MPRGTGSKAGDAPLRVAFDSRAARNSTGIARYARSLARALADLPGVALSETHQPRAGRVDVYHSPWIDGASLRPVVPMVVTLHDVIPLKRPGEYLRSGLRFKLRYLAVQRATRVIVPTQAVAQDVRRTLAIAPEQLVVVGEAADPAFHPRGAAEVRAARERFGLPERYLLWVGGLQSPDPRKRIAALSRAPRELALVLVGSAGRWARELENVILTDEVNDAELAAIYTGAHAVVFPSDDEGFGLVPVEALACGTPVVASDIPALREVLGERASFVPAGELATLIAAAEHATRPAPPPLSATWSDIAAATMAVYREALAAAGGPTPRPRSRSAPRSGSRSGPGPGPKSG